MTKRRIVEVGTKFARLTVLEELPSVTTPGGTVRRVFRCQCDCGKILPIRLQSLLSGNTRSCGCLMAETAAESCRARLTGKPSPRRKAVFPGTRYSRLVVIREVGSEKDPWGDVRLMVECACDCGNVITVMAKSLRNGKCQSCGCLLADKRRERALHNLAHHSLYSKWTEMKTRCYNRNRPQYKDYGGRGICVCDAWKHNRERFVEWALTHGWRPGLEIDRYPDNNGNYEPSNCRFVTKKANNRNSRKNHIVAYHGKSLCLAEWADETDIPASTIRHRLKRGWSVERALTTGRQTSCP